MFSNFVKLINKELMQWLSSRPRRDWEFDSYVFVELINKIKNLIDLSYFEFMGLSRL